MANSSLTRRDFLKGTAAVSGMAVGGALGLGACTATQAGDALENARESGSIRVGIAGEVPYGFTENGRVTGEAPEVARVVFRNLGVPEIQAQQVDFDGLIGGLNARRFDVVSAGMFITPTRCEQAAFSIPDYIAQTAFLVPAGNPRQVTRFQDIIDKRLRLVVLSGAVEQGYARDSGVPEDQLRTTADQVGMLQEVVNGRADAGCLTNISLNRLVQDNPAARVEVTDGFTPVIDGREVVSAGAFVFRKEDEALREAFNGELRRIHEDGTWLRVVRPFGFTEENLPGPDITTERLCRQPAG